MAATRAGPASSRSVSSTALSTCFAFWLQTVTQLPQAMQRVWMTLAWPSRISMALTGHSRTHV